MAVRPAAGRRVDFFFARSARHIMVDEGTRSSFTLPSTSLFTSTSDIKPKTSCSNNKDYQDIATASAIFIQHPTSLHDARNRTFALTHGNDDHSGRAEHAAPRHARIAWRALRLRLGNPAAPSASLRRTPHHFAVATPAPTNLRCSDYESPLFRVCCLAAGPDLLSSFTPSHPHPRHSHSFPRPHP